MNWFFLSHTYKHFYSYSYPQQKEVHIFILHHSYDLKYQMLFVGE